MGGKNSIPVEAVEGFTPEEVNRLQKRFKKLDKEQKDDRGVIFLVSDISSCLN